MRLIYYKDLLIQRSDKIGESGTIHNETREAVLFVQTLNNFDSTKAQHWINSSYVHIQVKGRILLSTLPHSSKQMTLCQCRLMLDMRRRRWANIKSGLVQRLVLARPLNWARAVKTRSI